MMQESQNPRAEHVTAALRAFFAGEHRKRPPQAPIGLRKKNARDSTVHKVRT